MDAHYRQRKATILTDHPETIVELGAGYGANFRYLKPGTRLIVIEPNESYNALLQRRAKKFNINLEIHNTGAEAIDLPSESVEMVLSSLVLCTVEDPDKVLSEVHRILKVQGRFVFIEHVAAGHQTWLCQVQNLVKAPWKWFFDGCNVTRETGSTIQNSSFDQVELEAFKSKTIFLPIIPHISGKAIK